MEGIFIVLGVAALLYVIAILMIHGLTSFLWFWPLFAAVQFLMFALVRYVRRKQREKKRIHPGPFVFIFTSYGLWMLVLLALLGTIFFHAHTVEQKNLDYVIVMGTDLVDNRISPSLKKRLDCAVAYAKENPDTIFVLSGGRSDYDRSTEATVMYYYMIKAGIPENRLLLEFYSHSTQEKIGFSLRTIQQDQEARLRERAKTHPGLMVPLHGTDGEEIEVILGEEKPITLGIITSEFNLFRACRIAARFGYPDACPMATETSELMLVHLSVREAIAVFKDRLIGNI